jgi:hypothetical protein
MAKKQKVETEWDMIRGHLTPQGLQFLLQQYEELLRREQEEVSMAVKNGHAYDVCRLLHHINGFLLFRSGDKKWEESWQERAQEAAKKQEAQQQGGSDAG